MQWNAPGTPPSGRPLDRFASWVLGGPLAVGLLALCALQLATWIPNLLTWPFFSDHDVFATMALGWDAGRLPYRDCLGNNFPGTIYLFWVAGKAFGWGKTLPVFAIDAALVVLLGVALVGWSRRQFRSGLPGAAGYAVFLGYYLGLDYSQVCQRDWHGPLFMVLGLMLAGSSTSRSARLGSALCAAAALAIRPQVVLFLPAMTLAIARRGQAATPSRGRTAATLLLWAALVALFTAAAFLPIVASGTWHDFLRGVRLTAYGGRYNQVGASSVLRQLVLQAMHLEYVFVPIGIVLAARPGEMKARGPVPVWLLATAGAWLYKPLSPVPWPYLSHPLALIAAADVAVLVHLILAAEGTVPSLRLCAILMTVLAGGLTPRPEYCRLGESLRAVRELRRGGLPRDSPSGFLGASEDAHGPAYPWEDYRDVVDYLRRRTCRSTRVANLLRLPPALTGPTARLSSLPAESLAWLVVNPHDEGRFLASLEQAGDSVVVWKPEEANLDDQQRLAPAIRRLAPAVRRHYRPEARFGPIEVWRRTTSEAGPSPR